MRQLILDIRPDAPPTFANYLAGSNTEPVSVLQDAARGKAAEAVIYLWGPQGVGKTHLLRAAVDAARNAGLAAAYHAGRSLPEALPALLAVDDVQGLTAADQIVLFNHINTAREGRCVILAAGDLPPTRLPLRPDLASRLSWGLVYGLMPLSDEDKMTALIERARGQGMALPQEVGQYLLAHCRRDLPSLLAMVDELDAYSMSLKRPVSVPLLKAMLARG